jgi:DNA-directed RNA polymerase specialized sigma24 family protein
MDTHATIEARWANEVIDKKVHASAVEVAYQKSRIYEELGQKLEVCIVLVHHTGKLKNNHALDYHERINMPATVVAGATASFVLADLPDRDQHDEDDHKRIFAIRGRNILKDTPLQIEMKDGRVALLGLHHEIVQTEAQAEVMECIEAFLAEQETVSIKEVAASLGRHYNTVQGLLSRAAKACGGTIRWKGRTLELSRGRPLRWKQ